MVLIERQFLHRLCTRTLASLMLCASLCFVLATGGHGIKVERSNSELVLEPLACAFCAFSFGRVSSVERCQVDLLQVHGDLNRLEQKFCIMIVGSGANGLSRRLDSLIATPVSVWLRRCTSVWPGSTRDHSWPQPCAKGSVV